MYDTEAISLLQKMTDSAKRIVFFSGAGMSTESGIPDFRSATGIYRMNFCISPERIVSRSFLDEDPETFFEFYRTKLLHLEARPNPAHYKLAELERAGKLSAVVTQNVDGLHHEAGCRNVFELHGSVYRNYCTACGRSYGIEAVAECEGVPRCNCGGMIRPDVVLFEESLDMDVLDGAVRAIAEADMLIVGGTSLAVYPAAGLVSYYRGNRLAIINRDETPLDGRADLVIHGSVGEVLDQITV